jgi:hypothetical protein
MLVFDETLMFDSFVFFTLSWILTKQPKQNKSLQLDMLLHMGTLSRLWSYQSLHFPPYCCILSGEAYTNVIAFGLSWPAITSTIYHTHGKHANRYILSGEADTNVIAFGLSRPAITSTIYHSR